MGETVYLGLGSNLGDRLQTLGRAVRLLDAQAGLSVTASSRVWETAPIGGPAQPEFLNAVVRVSSELSPSDLLDACHQRKAVWNCQVADRVVAGPLQRVLQDHVRIAQPGKSPVDLDQRREIHRLGSRR